MVWAKGLFKLVRSASKNITSPYITISGRDEKNTTLSNDRLLTNLTYKIIPNMAVIPNSTKPIIPSVENLKVKVLLAKIIPSKTLFPKIIAGMSAKTNIIKKIFVDIFILLFFAKKKIVYMSIKSNFLHKK